MFAVASASGWTFKAKLFPLVVGIPLVVLAGIQLLLDLRGRGEAAAGPPVDLEFSAEVPEDVARRRTVTLFAWIVGFVALVWLVGFPIAVPVFMGSYLLVQSGAGWWTATGLTALSWGFFYGVFQWALRLPFESGRVETWLGW